jgi:hypothetical protein
MPYTHFRYIAYEVPTATSRLQGNNTDVVSGFHPGPLCPPIPRIPVDANTPPDALHRLRRLAAVVDRAKTVIDQLGGDDNNTLKIFMVPEFYFRPPIPAVNPDQYTYNTYPYEEAEKLLEELNVMFLHADFRHWLIVAGTVMWNWQDMQSTDYRNSAVHVRGNEVESLRVIEKDVPSHIDGVPNPYANIHPYDPYIEKTFQEWTSRKYHVFDVGGITLGLEVCLDHGTGHLHRVLKTVLSQWPLNEGNMASPRLSLHLLTAGGMGINNESIAAKKGGFILRNDGYSGAPRSQFQRVPVYTKPRGLQRVETVPEDLAGAVPHTGTINPTHHVQLMPPELVPMFDPLTYRQFPQRIAIYPKCILS